jgi:hypothetical protein
MPAAQNKPTTHDAIPQVIQNALNSNDSQPFIKNAAIRGLQPFLLPNYISLRSGGELPHYLHRAQEEEKSSRQRSSRANKKKRRRGREKVRDGMARVDAIETVGTEAAASASGQGCNRKKRRRCKSTCKEKEPAMDSNEWLYYQVMARIVVAPYTPFLIETVNGLQQMQQGSTNTKNALADNGLPSKKAKTTRAASHETRSTSIVKVQAARAPTVKNVYLKSNTSHAPKSSNYITISPPRESLESLVDGVVCSLVQRTHRLRKAYPAKAKSSNVKLVHRRRQRKDKSKKPPQSIINGNSTRSNTSSVNDWLRSSNILSKGYSLGSSDTLSSYYSRTNNKLQNPTLRACPNMAPGVHCIQPNSLTTYARSSGLMRLLHSVIGDEILSELLLNAIVLVPAIDGDTGEHDSSSQQSATLFGRGNFFQLCGPPLNVVSKQFESMRANSSVKANESINASASETTKIITGSSSKRKRDDDDCSKYNQPASKQRQNNAWDANRPIPRSKLFYCDFFARRIGLPPNHMLNQTSRDTEAKLLDSMVQLWPRRSQSPDSNNIVYSNKRRARWRRLRETGIMMCREVIRRHKQCDYARLLERHCPLLVGDNKTGQGLDPKEELTHLVTLYTPNEDVGLFLEAVLRNAFPSAFWGTKHNFCQVIKTMNVFINLRLTETFPEKLINEGIRVLDVKWLHPEARSSRTREFSKKNEKLSRSGHESAVANLHNVMRWLYCQYITPLLRSIFYITDTEFTGRCVVYYRRPVWSRIRSLSLGSLLKHQYRDRSVVKAKRVLSTHNVGCPPAPLRLLPKKTGIRAIAMLSKACAIKDTEVKGCNVNSLAPNKILQSAFQALKYEFQKYPRYGSGALGVTEVLSSYCCFLDVLRRKFVSNNKAPRLYFTSADIEHCYDNINQEHLYKQIRDVLIEDQYITQNHFIIHSKDSNKSTRCRWQKTTCSPANFLDITSTSTGHIKQFYNAIFIDGISFSVEKKQTIIGLLKDHIFGQMIIASGSNGQRLVLQRNGIPQVCAGKAGSFQFKYSKLHLTHISTKGKHSFVIVLQCILWQC